ncbi:MAG TPA: lasso peptide biosynthesis B2 protein [Thermoanaerobaculia bacterium]|nr:lasso peptide biosynthesis B2 protein [Thermoanaerobaculia bacterium]
MDSRALRPAAHVRAAFADGIGVLLDLRSGRYIALNAVGATLWRALLAGAVLDEVLQRLALDCGQPVERLRQDAGAFMAQARKAGLLADAGSHPPASRDYPGDADGPTVAPPADATEEEAHVTPSRLWLPAAWCLVFCVERAGRLLGFARMQALLHRLPRPARRRDLAAARTLAATVNRAAELQPGRARCLERSAATLVLLRLLGWPAEMVIGVQPRPFVAHAWVELGGRVLNDRQSVRHTYLALERC